MAKDMNYGSCIRSYLKKNGSLHFKRQEYSEALLCFILGHDKKRSDFVVSLLLHRIAENELKPDECAKILDTLLGDTFIDAFNDYRLPATNVDKISEAVSFLIRLCTIIECLDTDPPKAEDTLNITMKSDVPLKYRALLLLFATSFAN